MYPACGVHPALRLGGKKNLMRPHRPPKRNAPCIRGWSLSLFFLSFSFPSFLFPFSLSTPPLSPIVIPHRNGQSHPSLSHLWDQPATLSLLLSSLSSPNRQSPSTNTLSKTTSRLFPHMRRPSWICSSLAISTTTSFHQILALAPNLFILSPIVLQVKIFNPLWEELLCVAIKLRYLGLWLHFWINGIKAPHL